MDLFPRAARVNGYRNHTLMLRGRTLCEFNVHSVQHRADNTFRAFTAGNTTMIQPNHNYRGRLLVLDEDRIVAETLAQWLRKDGYDVRTTDNLAAANQELEIGIDVLLVDLNVDRSPADVLRDLRKRHPHLMIVALAGYGTIEQAVEATRGGAFHYLTKPLVEEEICRTVERAIGHRTLTADDTPTTAAAPGFEADNIIGRDYHMQRVYELAEAVADSRTTVLIVGESGTGKSALARAIHRRSQRRAKPFVEIACGSLSDTLLESELFGHVKGSFTNAVADKAGRFLAADTGTIFLDEINSAPPAMQVKLLRVLQEKSFEPVGGDITRTVDVRAILATNVDLQQLVAAGTFRQDLYYRINVVSIAMPALRQRPSDIPLLAEHFLRKFCSEMNRKIIGFSEAAISQMMHYAWPGNVRELENAVERAVVLCRRPRVEVDDLPETLQSRRSMNVVAAPAGVDPGPLPLEKALELPERHIIAAALGRNNWNRQATAAELEINRTTLYKKMIKHGLDMGPVN